MTTFAPKSMTRRPRNVNAFQAAAILYGDWGTSKAYVMGLAFAIAAYSSFWLILAVSILITLVGLNYITICKYSPSGGGVYASARKKSVTLALIGAFFLIGDYLLTVSLSALSCFKYIGVAHAEYWAMTAIVAIGLINFFGPKHSGNAAFVVAIPAVICVVLISIAGLPYVKEAIASIQSPQGGFLTNWKHFIGVIVALSGIEAIANTTGVMQLDPGTTYENPSVHQTSKRAIIAVMLEVTIFTTFLALLMQALPGLHVVDDSVQAPNQTDVRDSMLRYMGNFFVSHQYGTTAGYLFGTIISVAFGVLLLSAVNTALIAMVSLLFVMSRDGEVPAIFQRLNAFGVPHFALCISTLIPIVILFFVHDVASLADLYAVGFVGAIATNVGINAYSVDIPMQKSERYLMWFTFIIMAAIEVSLLVYKPHARRFALSILTVGLTLSAFMMERRQKVWAGKKVKLKQSSLYHEDAKELLHPGAYLCAINSIGKTLSFALQEAKKFGEPLYILFVREQKVMTEEDHSRIWLDDDEACKIFDSIQESCHETTLKFLYAVSDSPPRTIVRIAKELKVSRLILGRPRHSVLMQILRGNIIQEVAEILPREIDLLIIA